MNKTNIFVILLNKNTEHLAHAPLLEYLAFIAWKWLIIFYLWLEHFAGFGKPVERLISSFCKRTHHDRHDFPRFPATALWILNVNANQSWPQRALLALQRRVPTLANGKQFRANAPNARCRRYSMESTQWFKLGQAPCTLLRSAWNRNVAHKRKKIKSLKFTMKLRLPLDVNLSQSEV